MKNKTTQKPKIITISGDPASGKSTCVREITEKFEKDGYKVKIISVGQIFRKLAQEKGMTIEEFTASLEKGGENDTDLIVENSTKKLGEKILTEGKHNEIYIVDSRMAWWCIPNSFKVRLTTNSKVAGERAFNDTTRGEEDRFETLEEAIESTEDRKEIERRKYKAKYGVDITDVSNYDLVIDSTYSKAADISQCVYECFNNKEKGKYFHRTWTSPRVFLPMQNMMETVYGLEEIKESIKTRGYDQTQFVEIIQANGLPFIHEGHHRIFAALANGKSLIPYQIIAKDNELIPGTRNTPKTIVKWLTEDSRYNSMLYDYEESIGLREYNTYNEKGYVSSGNYGLIYGNKIYTDKAFENVEEKKGEER